MRKVAGERIDVVRPARGEMVQSLVTSGRVRPVRIRLAPVVSGIVTEILVTEGERVSAGQTLLRIDDAEARAVLDNAEAALARAGAAKKKLRTVSRKDADETVRQARARLAEAQRDFDRHESLVTAGAVTRAQYERAETNLALANSALRAATALRADLGSGGASMVSSEAALTQARADVALAEARLGYTQLQAPAAGVVLTRSAEVGDAVGANTEVMTLAATGRTELVIEPDERNLSLLRLGQRALASAEAFPDDRFEAEIAFIAPSVDSRRGTIEVRLHVADPPPYLRPDMTVSVDVEVARKPDALTLPVGAIVEMASDAPFVLIVEDGHAVRRSVELGIIDSRRVEVLSGLDGAEQIIERPEVVSPGDRVRPREAPP